ncbi:podocalyxin [Urocitellus parryii]
MGPERSCRNFLMKTAGQPFSSLRPSAAEPQPGLPRFLRRSMDSGGPAGSGYPSVGAGCPAGTPRQYRSPHPTRSRTRTHTHPLARAARPRSPSRCAPGRSFLLCSLFAAQRPPSHRPARPRCGLLARSWGRGQRPARTGRGGSRRSRRRSSKRSDTARTQPPLLLYRWLCAPTRLCGREEGPPEPDSRVRGHRQALGAIARPPRAAPTFQTHRPCANPAATCFGPGGEGTMRSALALSALLLLLHLPPASLSQDDTAGKDGSPAAGKDGSPPAGKDGSPAAAPATTVKTNTVSSTKPQTSGTTSDPATSTKLAGSSASTSRGGSLNPTQPSTSAATTVSTTTSVTQSGSTTPSSPTLTTTEKAAFQSTDKGYSSSGHTPTATPATHRTQVPNPPPPEPTTTKNPPVESTGSPGSHHSTAATVKTLESSTSGQHSLTLVPSGSSPAPGTSGPTSKVLPTTQTSSDSTIAPKKEHPPCTPEGTRQTSSQMPPKPTPSSSMTSPLEGSPSSPSSRTGATSTVGGDTHPSTRSASTSPQGLSTTSSTLAPGKPKVDCMPPERLDKKLLILNLTETSPCAKSPPADNKLITQLCQAVKATFNPAQDSCTVQLAPIQESQAVALKKITIQTNLLPENVYTLLKDKWDDLREVGVSHMQLGDEGPPEETEDRFSMPLIITIVCMASFLLLVAALYGCCHQRLSQRKDQQRLTEELQTVENGYHDNPTLEVMETSSEMQEKKVVNLNGELGDSWIVPLDNLTKDDLDEEDTHL